MKLGVLSETHPGERRVGLVPGVLATLIRDKHEVIVQSGAGREAGFPDTAYVAAGAAIVSEARALVEAVDCVVKVQPPRKESSEWALCRAGQSWVSHLAPFANAEAVLGLAAAGVSAYAMEFVPRITRAQSMDALSSQATVAGYKAVLIGAARLPRMFPLLMTAAGTVQPSNVLVLGAGVAGLQAIATARRLGARVEAFDPRPAVREQVKSLGAGFVEMELPKDAETTGGYAKELSPEFIQKEMEAIGGRLPKTDLVICTAQIFGKRAPLLITGEMVRLLKPGSVIVDLAAEQGGNCECTRAGETVEVDGVSIIGAVNLPSTVPSDASALYARNVVNLVRHLFPKPGVEPDAEDEIVKGCRLTLGGRVVHPALASLKSAV